MEDSKFLASRAVVNPLCAAAIATAIGALFGLAIHTYTRSLGTNEDPTPFVAGFAFTGTVVGMTISYCAHIFRYLKQRHSNHVLGQKNGWYSFIHGGLAGALLFGGGSLVLNIAKFPFLNGEPRGSEWLLFLFNGLFSVGGIKLLELLGISQAALSEMEHSKESVEVLTAVLAVPIASAVVGGFLGFFVIGILKLRR